ncbi:MAG: hypothetical protein PHC88_10610 [Terrimicrobiaceae bacterium]|nr:hypothetical protein [Terrimicrobiaceae bacterium]
MRKVQSLLDGATGIRRVAPRLQKALVHIVYDARFTNPAAIHESLLAGGYRASKKAE